MFPITIEVDNFPTTYVSNFIDNTMSRLFACLSEVQISSF